MNSLSSIGDEEFIPFLHGLGVETYSKSFEWMLSDPEFGDVLRWIYNNLDHNNALSAREECRYAEIEKQGKLLSSEDLDVALTSIQSEYSGISLPGDKETIEDVKLDIVMHKERLTMLESHDKVLKDLAKQNQLMKHELDKEMLTLNAVLTQCDEDETAASQECVRLDGEVEAITSSVLEAVGDTLEVYSSCGKDKETAKRFLTFGPQYTTYRQSQSLFRSHFDLYTARKFDRRTDEVTDEELRTALLEAKSLEGRLSNSLAAYIESYTELAGEQAKLALVSNYNNVHPSQITSCVLEEQGALALLEQEEGSLVQELRSAAEELVASRTALAVATAANGALRVREQISKDLAFLVDVSQRALAVDRLVYWCLRHELRSLEECLHFAAHLRLCVAEERAAVAARLRSMKEIMAEQKASERGLDSSDRLPIALGRALRAHSTDAEELVRARRDALCTMHTLRATLAERFSEKERAVEEYNLSVQPLVEYVFDGCTRLPGSGTVASAALAHALGVGLGGLDRAVLEATTTFQAVKNGDNRHLRKLWQWFLTDPARLMAAVRSASDK